MKCRLRGGEVHYEARGQGRSLLVLHGGYLDHRHMVSVMEPVFDAGAGWRRVYPDMPGHGRTTIANSIESHDQVLDVLEEFMDRLHPGQRYAVAGESRGGFLARGLAARNPDRVDGLLLIVPGRYAEADPEYLPRHVTLEPADELRGALRQHGRLSGRFERDGQLSAGDVCDTGQGGSQPVVGAAGAIRCIGEGLAEES